jgi:hypothetical protein
MKMKTQILRGLVISRKWANTPRGERQLMTIINTMVALLAACITLLVVGFILQ